MSSAECGTWHILGWTKDVSISITRAWRWCSDDIPWERAVAVLGDDLFDRDACITVDEARRLLRPEQAAKRHPAVKANHRRAHRRSA